MTSLEGRTCLANCRMNHDCTYCGRSHCSGDKCDMCGMFCWQLDPFVNGDTAVYISPNARRVIHCSGEWQIGWRRLSYFFPELSTVSLRLMVTVVYEDTALGFTAAYFDSVQYVGGLLSVGTFTGGEGGNGWGAPFNNRPLTTPDNSIEPFFYPGGVTRAGGVPTYQEQQDLNYTNIIKGYYWPSSDPEKNVARIIRITLWVIEV